MKAFILSLLFLGCVTTANAQISEKQLKPFIPEGYSLADASGDGLKHPSGDILLELVSNEPDEFETLVLLHHEKGKLRKIGENANLLMGKEMLGNSGGTYPSLSGNILSADYSLGSNSAQSEISIKFEKVADGNYYFKEYTISTTNYGVENLFARQKITATQTGKLNFSEASEDQILKKGMKNSPIPSDDEPVYKASTKYAKYIPEGWRLATYATGDLNLDKNKKDLILWLYNDAQCRVKLLLQQNDGKYKTAAINKRLFRANHSFNTNNLKVVIKNGYFTLEQRVATSNTDFDHRYVSFHYNKTDNNWLLHRYDVEHFSGFNKKPVGATSSLTQKDFGKPTFQNLDKTPGDYLYAPATTTLQGTIIKKTFYGRPNYGETPEKDEKVIVYILKTNYPINVIADPDQSDSETANKTIRGIAEIQVYSANKNIGFLKYLNKKVTLKGTLMQAQAGGHYTNVLMQVTQITN